MSMKRTLGAVLIVIGLIALTWGGVFWTRNKTVLDVGPLEVNQEKREGISLPPIVGFVTLVGGIVLFAIPERRGA